MKKDIKNTLILFATLLVYSLLVSFFAGAIGLNDLEKVANSIQEIKIASPLILSYFLIARVASEEIFFRGLLVKKTGVIFSAIFFGLAHTFYGSIVEVMGAIVLGGILGIAFKENGNIMPNILAHFLYNFTFIMIIA